MLTSPPLYRVTLFYGPDPVEEDPSRVLCVFNVKKRSWKGGVQVAVEVHEGQLSRLRVRLGFDPWLHALLASVPEAERDHYATRAQESFVQEVSAVKLSLALESDFPQESTRLDADLLGDELERAVMEGEGRIKTKVRADLDLGDG
ncbi:hypothetical protein [Candidatus Nitrospira bockiana]